MSLTGLLLSLILLWTPNTEADLAGYRVYRQSSLGWELVAKVPVMAEPTYTVELADGCYAVTAFNTEGMESAPSNQVCTNGQPPDAPLSPLNLRIKIGR